MDKIDSIEGKNRLLDEAALIEQVSQGNGVALLKLYEIYVEPIHRFCYSQVGNVSEAEDITSETFKRALEAMLEGRYSWQYKPFGAWLHGIARHVLFERQRKLQHMPITERWEDMLEDNEPASEQQDTLDSIIQREEQDALWQLVKELTIEEQRLLVMRHVYELSYAEIAQRLNRSEQACKQWHYRVLRKLKLKAQEADQWDEIIGGKEKARR